MNNFLSICAVIKNEAPYIEEWMCFHILQGVTHFFIYDNGSDDGTIEILERYKKRGLVTYETMLDRPIQFKAYNKCLDAHAQKSTWIAFLDCDEFLYSPFKPSGVVEFLKHTPSNTFAVAAHWYLYGSNHHEKFDARFVTERFLRRDINVNQHVKSIVKPLLTKEVGKNPHYFISNYPYEVCAYNENLAELPEEYALNPLGTANTLRINHYHTKSHSEYLKRRTRPDVASGLKDTEEEMEVLFKAHDCNEVFDITGALYVDEIASLIRSYE